MPQMRTFLRVVIEMQRKRTLSNETCRKIWAERIYLLMRNNNVTQADLAAALGVQRQTISNYANGQSCPDCESLKMIADYFQVSADWIIGNDRADTAVSNIYFNQLSQQAQGNLDYITNVMPQLIPDIMSIIDSLISCDSLCVTLVELYGIKANSESLLQEAKDIQSKTITTKDYLLDARLKQYDIDDRLQYNEYRAIKSFSEPVQEMLGVKEIQKELSQLKRNLRNFEQEAQDGQHTGTPG